VLHRNTLLEKKSQKRPKIGCYGNLQIRNNYQRINEISAFLLLEPRKAIVKVPMEITMLSKFGIDILKCHCCEKGRLVLVRTAYPKGIMKNKASPLER